jgi:hypothetical protein
MIFCVVLRTGAVMVVVLDSLVHSVRKRVVVVRTSPNFLHTAGIDGSGGGNDRVSIQGVETLFLLSLCSFSSESWVYRVLEVV